MDEEEHTAVQWKRCPRCKAFIRQSLRYGNILKQIKKDMNQIKVRESTSLSRQQRETLLTETVQLCREYGREINLKEDMIHNVSDKALQGKHAVLLALSVAKVTFDRSVRIYGCIQMEKQKGVTSMRGTLDMLEEHILQLQSHTEELRQFLTSFQCMRLVHLPQQVYNDIHAERRRLSLLGKVDQLVCDAIKNNVTLSAVEMDEIIDLVKRFSPPNCRPEKMTDEEEYLNRVKKIKGICNHHPQLNALTKQERMMVVQAIEARTGSWYKCPNGHYYNIGECGGATVEGRCIECKALVGGRNHRLRDDNTHAGEIDGSAHAAWSEQANLRNYDLRGFIQ